MEAEIVDALIKNEAALILIATAIKWAAVGIAMVLIGHAVVVYSRRD